MLFIGEEVGAQGPARRFDIAVDPLEGDDAVRKRTWRGRDRHHGDGRGRPRCLNAPDVYMEKIAIGPGYAKGVIDLDAPAEQNIRNLAKAKGRRTGRYHGAGDGPAAPCRPDRGDPQDRRGRFALITDGDVAGVNPHHRSGQYRHRHLYRRRRRAGGRAGGLGAALHRRADAMPAWCSTPRRSASARSRWASRTRARKYEIEDMGERRLPVRRHRRHGWLDAARASASGAM